MSIAVTKTQSIYENIDFLKGLIDKIDEPELKDEMNDFLSAIRDDADDIYSEIDDLEDDVEEKESKISDLKRDLDDAQDDLDDAQDEVNLSEHIDTGLGIIYYDVKGSLINLQIMEALEQAFSRRKHLDILKALETL